jgi:transporter family protein
MIPRWLLWTLLTMLTWGIWGVLGKPVGEVLSPLHSQLLSTVGLIPVIVALFFVKEPAPRGHRPFGTLMAFGSGIASSLGNIVYYELLAAGANAATITPLTALAPIVTVLLAVLLLKERLNGIQMVGVALSLLAIFLFNMQDEGGLDSSAMLLALAPIGLWGLAGFLQKLATNHISAGSSGTWFLVAFFPVAGWILWREPVTSEVSIHTWALASALGFTLALGNFTILLAFASGAKASVTTPLAGLYPLVSVPIAIVWFEERIGLRSALGVAFALAAVAMLSYEPRVPNDSTLNPEPA